VARSHECDWPESVKSLPQASKPSFPTGGTSRAIGRRCEVAAVIDAACTPEMNSQVRTQP